MIIKINQIIIIKVTLLTLVWTYRHEDNKTRRLLESIREQLTHDNHDYVDTTTITGSIYITKPPVIITDARRNMEVGNEEHNEPGNMLEEKQEDAANKVKIMKEKAVEKNEDIVVDDSEENMLRHVIKRERKPNANRKYMIYDNKKGEVSLVKFGGSFPMFRLPRERAQYRASDIE